ncbi:MAG: dihydroneopterin aldolase [Campylobacterota bacterium]|nr:dihydroneopterin aldolase [Campylobacterota bacterium]
MTIHIESLQIDTIIGLLDFERKKEQRIFIDLEATYIYEKGIFINYADLATLIESQIKQAQYELLEEALLEIKESIITCYPSIESLKLKITKPDILKNCHVALSHDWREI